MAASYSGFDLSSPPGNEILDWVLSTSRYLQGVWSPHSASPWG